MVIKFTYVARCAKTLVRRKNENQVSLIFFFFFVFVQNLADETPWENICMKTEKRGPGSFMKVRNVVNRQQRYGGSFFDIFFLISFFSLNSLVVSGLQTKSRFIILPYCGFPS